MTHRVTAFGALLLALLVARAASAQTVQADSPSWLKDRRFSEGIGIRVGNLELHPGVAGEVGYDSNWLLRTDRTVCGGGRPCDNGPPAAPIIPALEFRVTPSLNLSTLGPQRLEGDGVAAPPDVTFRAGVSATWRAFLGLGGKSTGNSDISQQNSPLPSIGAGVNLGILPGRPVGGALFASFGRTVQPNQTSADPNLSFNRDSVGVGGELALQPGSGTLDWHFGYQLNATLFESSTALGFNNATHEAFTRGRWRFRPRTALVYDATIRFLSYGNADQAAQQGLVNSTPIRTRIGMNGLVGDRFAVMALVGWAASLYDKTLLPQAPQYDSVIGQAELTWFLSAGSRFATVPEGVGLALSTVTLGYNRDFQNSYLGNYYGSDRGYLRFAYFFAGRALVTLEGGLGAIEYPTMYWLPPAVPAITERHAAFTDLRADATLFSEYRFSDSIGLNTTLRYTANFSSVHDLPDQLPTAGMGVFDMGWSRFEAFLGLRWFM